MGSHRPQPHRPPNGIFTMTKAEFDTLLTWYHDTLSRVKTFNFTDPFTLTVREFRFASAPAGTHIGNGYFVVSFNLETV